MRKIILSGLLGFTLSNHYAAHNYPIPDANLLEMTNSGVTAVAPEGFPHVTGIDDLYGFYPMLKECNMVTVDEATNTAFIGGYVFMDDFAYEFDITGIIASILDLCLSKNKFSSAKSKIEEWEANLINNIHNKDLYKDEAYVMFVQLFAEVFLATHARELAKFDAVEFELKFVYVDETNCFMKMCDKIAHYIALASDKITCIQELFVKNSFIKGKYKIQTNKSGTDIKVLPLE